MFPPMSIWKMDLSSYEDTCDLNLMQYTGLKDKNGKDIYEGDILCRQDVSRAYTVVFCQNEYQSGWKLRASGSENHIDIGNKEEKEDMGYQIIGNIHENPELLDG